MAALDSLGEEHDGGSLREMDLLLAAGEKYALDLYGAIVGVGSYVGANDVEILGNKAAHAAIYINDKKIVDGLLLLALRPAGLWGYIPVPVSFSAGDVVSAEFTGANDKARLMLHCMVVTPLCDCGKRAPWRCCEPMTIEGLVPCLKPSCLPDGKWCEAHRHAPGTMGYPGGGCRATAFSGFKGTGPIWDRLKAWWWNQRNAQWQANKLLANHVALFPPPAPMPPFEIRFVDGSLWKSSRDMTRMEKA